MYTLYNVRDDWNWRDYIICALRDGVITAYEAIIALDIDNLDGWNKQRQDAVIDFKAGVVSWNDLKRILES